MKMKKFIFAILIFSLFFLNCSNSNKKKIKIKGPQEYIAAISALIPKFSSRYPYLNLILEPCEDARAIASYLDGTCDIAIATRKLNSEELNYAAILNKKVHPYSIASDAVRVIVSKSIRLENLSLDLLKRILTQKVVDWKEVLQERINELIKQNEINRAQKLKVILNTMFSSQIEICLLNNLYAMHSYLLDLINAKNFSSQIKFFKDVKSLTRYVSINNNAIGLIPSVSNYSGCEEVPVDNIKISYETLTNYTYPLIRKYYIMIPKNYKDLEIIDLIFFLRSSYVKNFLKERGFSKP